MRVVRSNSGFHLWIVALVIAVFGVLAVVTLQVMNTSESNKSFTVSIAPSSATQQTTTQPTTSTAATVTWASDGKQWTSAGTVPKCDEPVVLDAPVDLSKVRAILYPGQVRGGNYKPHGGFLMSGDSNDITVTAPMDATVVHGSRYIESGEVQHLLLFINDCGIAYRFDHLLTLSPAMQKLADTLPPAKKDDSRTTNFEKPVKIKKGEAIATAVGFKVTKNIGFDWGVYDLRTMNEASKNAAYASKNGQFSSQAFYAVCWLNWLSPKNSEIAKALPAGDMVNGSKSDYCK